MTITQIRENKAFIAWADAERDFEDFMHARTMGAVRLMTDNEFIAWLVEYRRLYDALWNAQAAYYAALRTT